MEQGYPRNIPEERFLRLAAYEDLFERLGLDFTDQKQVNELSALVKARDEGRVVELPCKVGDTVYLTARGFIEELKVRTFFVGHPSYNRGEPDPGIEMIRLTNCDVSIKKFGKTIFHTHAEAEAVLQKGDGHD